MFSDDSMFINIIKVMPETYRAIYDVIRIFGPLWSVHAGERLALNFSSP